MFAFQRKKLTHAILLCSVLPIGAQAASYEDAYDLGFMEWTNMGISTGSGRIAENNQLQAQEFLYLINNNKNAGVGDSALYMVEKNSALTILTDHDNPDDPGFNSTIISSYTENAKTGIAVKIGNNHFTEAEKPSLSGSSGADFFADKTGILANSANVDLKNISISALDTGLSIEDVTYDRRGNVIAKGAGSKVNLEEFKIQFDASRFNTVINDISSNPPDTPANFTNDQKTNVGVYVDGTGIKGETIVNLKSGEIHTQGAAVNAYSAATVNLDDVNISTQQTTGGSINASNKDTLVGITNSDIKTRSTALSADTGAEIYIEDSHIERQNSAWGVAARGENSKVTVKNTNMTLTSGGGAAGNYGFTPAGATARSGGKVVLDNVRIKDQATGIDSMKGIFTDSKGEVVGNAVTYTSAEKLTMGVQFSEESKVTLTNSKFELTGQGSSGVVAGGGTFTADNTEFSSAGALIRVYKNSSGSSVINLNNGSKFVSDTVLLRNDFEADPLEDREVKLNADNSTLGGRILGGFTTDVSLKNNTTWSYSGLSTVRALTLNNATIQLNKPAAGQRNTLEVDTLNSTNGVIELWTEFNGDASKSDIIQINQEATGKTGLSFRNNNGTGEKTVNGIKVVDAIDNSGFGGPKATTAVDAFYIHASSDGYRTDKAGTIAVGAYDYKLKRGQGAPENENSWYLVSALKDSGDDNKGKPDPYRPEVGAYFASNQMARDMQRHKWQDRKGQTNGVVEDSVGWIRVQSDKSSFNDQFDNKRKSTSNIIHFGADVARFDLSDGSRLDLGVMGLLGSAESKTKVQTINAKANVTSYNLGAYATWQQNPAGKTGSYIDSWLLHGWNNNTVKGDGLRSEKYNSRMTSASLEVGHNFELAQTANQAWYLQPQAQVIWNKANNSNQTEKGTKTQIKWDNSNEVSTRLGARLAADFTLESGSQMSPFVEVNYWRNPKDQTIQFGNDRVKDKLPASAVELAFGVQGQINKDVQIWTRLGAQQGQHSYRNLNGQVGVTVKW